MHGEQAQASHSVQWNTSAKKRYSLERCQTKGHDMRNVWLKAMDRKHERNWLLDGCAVVYGKSKWKIIYVSTIAQQWLKPRATAAQLQENMCVSKTPFHALVTKANKNKLDNNAFSSVCHVWSPRKCTKIEKWHVAQIEFNANTCLSKPSSFVVIILTKSTTETDKNSFVNETQQQRTQYFTAFYISKIPIISKASYGQKRIFKKFRRWLTRMPSCCSTDTIKALNWRKLKLSKV